MDTSSRHVYEGYGLSICSDVALPMRPSAGPTATDLTIIGDESIAFGPNHLDRHAPGVIASLGDDSDPWYVAVRRADEVRLSFRRTAEFAIAPELDVIRWRMHPTADRAMLPVLLSGTVLALVLILQDRLVLHASAVAVDGRAIGFCGHQGRGKSTMAALGVAWGAGLVTDDVLVVDRSSPPRCRGNGGELRLRPAALSLEEVMPPSTEGRWTADQRRALAPAAGRADWLELGAIVVPRPSREANEVRAERIAPSIATLWLTSVPRVNGVTPPDLASSQFEQLAGLCSQVAVYDVTVPWGPPFDAAIFGQIAALLP